jgi:hypothetical protein
LRNAKRSLLSHEDVARRPNEISLYRHGTGRFLLQSIVSNQPSTDIYILKFEGHILLGLLIIRRVKLEVKDLLAVTRVR